jgi:hypothetical protein
LRQHGVVAQSWSEEYTKYDSPHTIFCHVQYL